jgi:hypothetical protein
MAAPGVLDQDCAQDAAFKLFGRSIPVLHSFVFAATATAAFEVSSNSLSSRIHSLTRDGDISWSAGFRGGGGGAGWSLPGGGGAAPGRRPAAPRMVIAGRF